jgi:hypothetical protein
MRRKRERTRIHMERTELSTRRRGKLHRKDFFLPIIEQKKILFVYFGGVKRLLIL